MKKHIYLLLLQFLISFFLSLAAYLLRPTGVLFFFLIYFLIPIFSAYTACKLVLKKINPYLAWLLPALAETAAGFLISLGFSPDPLPIMITSFVGLAGAATGDVLYKTNKKGKR